MSTLPDKPRGAKVDAGGFFRNISLRITAAGPAAVLITWMLSVVAITIWSDSETSKPALSMFAVVGGIIFVSFGQSKK